MKTCSKCKEIKALGEFGRNKCNAGGLNRRCRECVVEDGRRWRSENPEKHRKASRDWAGRNPVRVKEFRKSYWINNLKSQKAYCAAYYWANVEHKRFLARNRRAKFPDLTRSAYRAWAKANPHAILAYAADRRSRRRGQTILLTPEQRAEIVAIYAESVRLTRETGVLHHVDHEVPLKGKTVCGLHVPWNLRAIPAVENARKYNHFESA